MSQTEPWAKRQGAWEREPRSRGVLGETWCAGREEDRRPGSPGARELGQPAKSDVFKAGPDAGRDRGPSDGFYRIAPYRMHVCVYGMNQDRRTLRESLHLGGKVSVSCQGCIVYVTSTRNGSMHIGPPRCLHAGSLPPSRRCGRDLPQTRHLEAHHVSSFQSAKHPMSKLLRFLQTGRGTA